MCSHGIPLGGVAYTLAGDFSCFPSTPFPWTDFNLKRFTVINHKTRRIRASLSPSTDPKGGPLDPDIVSFPYNK